MKNNKDYFVNWDYCAVPHLVKVDANSFGDKIITWDFKNQIIELVYHEGNWPKDYQSSENDALRSFGIKGDA